MDFEIMSFSMTLVLTNWEWWAFLVPGTSWSCKFAMQAS